MSHQDSFMYEDDEYDFEFEDDDIDNENDLDNPDFAPDKQFQTENAYYSAKSNKISDLNLAIKQFRDIVSMETEKADWGFKALKQILKAYMKLGDEQNALGTYKELLEYIKTSISKNYAEKTLLGILDRLGDFSRTVVEEFFMLTLDTLSSAKNHSLFIKVNIKYCQPLLDAGEFGKLESIITKLKLAINGNDQFEANKSSQMLEVHGMELQMYLRTKHNKKLEKVYNDCLKLKSAVPHPRLNGLIRECGGKMYMTKKNWDKATSEFFESFKNYDDAGANQRIQVLRYLILVVMLSGSTINPFDSPETKPFEQNPEVRAIAELAQAYQSQDYTKFIEILDGDGGSILEDDFIQEYISEIMMSMQQKMLLATVKSYSRVPLFFLAKKIRADEQSIVEMLALAIVDGKLEGRVDEQQRIYVHTPIESNVTLKYDGMRQWAEELENLYNRTARNFA